MPNTSIFERFDICMGGGVIVASPATTAHVRACGRMLPRWSDDTHCSRSSRPRLLAVAGQMLQLSHQSAAPASCGCNQVRGQGCHCFPRSTVYRIGARRPCSDVEGDGRRGRQFCIRRSQHPPAVFFRCCLQRCVCTTSRRRNRRRQRIFPPVQSSGWHVVQCHFQFQCQR